MNTKKKSKNLENSTHFIKSQFDTNCNTFEEQNQNSKQKCKRVTKAHQLLMVRICVGIYLIA